MADVESGDRIFDGEVTHPAGCPRGMDDCSPLARVASEGYASFMCCGENSEATRKVPGDRFRFCMRSIRGDHPLGVDILVNLDERDLVDTASVLMGAFSSDMQVRATDPTDTHPEATDED
jgi:hypothetical protein